MGIIAVETYRPFVSYGNCKFKSRYDSNVSKPRFLVLAV